MNQPDKDAQAEQPTERIAVMCSPSEKRAVRFVADARNTTESAVMREFSMEQVVFEYERIRRVIDEAA